MGIKLSNREKAMLYGLLLFAMAATVIYLVLLPAQSAREAHRLSMAALTERADAMALTVAEAGDLPARTAAAEAEIAALEAALLPDAEGHRLEAEVTALLLDAGLRPDSLTLREQDGASTAEVTAVGGLRDLDLLLEAVASRAGITLESVQYSAREGDRITFRLTFGLYTS